MIAASCLALILLVLFQFNWLMHSRSLLEKQFDQKVTMALCSALERVEKTNPAASLFASCKKIDITSCRTDTLVTTLEEPLLTNAIAASMQLYDIDAAYEVEIVDRPNAGNTSVAHSCSMHPLGQDSTYLQVTFPNKKAYVFKQMGVMVGSSVFILLFVSTMLVLSLYTLIRQKRMNEVSVDFFNNMAHEFRTPLTNISLALNLYRKRVPEAGQSKFLQVIQNESQRLLQQIERMLHVAKLEEGEYQLEKESLSLNDLVEEIIEDMHMQVAEKGGRIHLQESSRVVIEADRLHLGNAIRNLIDNAVKYCPQTPHIDIQLLQSTEEAHLLFQDNGKGICKAQQKEIFQKFRRAAMGNIQDQQGFGLGLAYVKTVVELHHGKINVQSEEGQGSLFHLCLPKN